MDTEILIIGSGMVGMSLAYQLKKRFKNKKIIIIEKEKELGMHSSGRNSGVIHAGIYYKPGSIKAKVCIEGAKMLKSWIKDNGLKINNCGKIITPQEQRLDGQLEMLFERGKLNGAKVNFINEKELLNKIPCARTSSGRALWSPNTSVVNPKEILRKLEVNLIELNINLIKGVKNLEFDQNHKCVYLHNKKKISYEYLFNCAGINSVEIAKQFNIGEKFSLIPFKGLYWNLKPSSAFNIKTNLYPVPDINIPFLGVHFTPSNELQNNIIIGPTATLALGSENYSGLENFQPLKTLSNLSILFQQYVKDSNGFRKYVHEQLPQAYEPFMLNSARKLIPEIKKEHVNISSKVGIRAQLFNIEEKKLVDDFLCINTGSSTHILNAISPAFTASFSLANLIIDQSKI